MAVDVFWACCEDQWMLAEEPAPVLPNFYAKQIHGPNDPLTQINACPAFNDSLQNCFALKSLYNYEFFIEDNKVISNVYNQDFFDEHLVIRSIEKKFFSFMNSYVFFSNADSLPASIGIYPYLEDNNITKRCITFHGKYDIAKWFRTTDFPFFLKQDYNSFKIDQGEIFQYIQFHTDQKINFIQFKYTERLEYLKNDGFKINFFNTLKNMANYYKKFKTKKLILQEIEKNIL